MLLPANFAELSVPDQLLVAVDRERVDRGLRPFIGLITSLNSNALLGANKAKTPPNPGGAYRTSDSEWIGNVVNALDADYQWMYNDGPGSGLPGCSSKQPSGCWVDRRILLDRFSGASNLVMGAAFDAAGDTSANDRGGTSLAATLAVARHEVGSFTTTWAQATTTASFATFPPLSSIGANESATGIADPAENVVAKPNYVDTCAATGLDASTSCTSAVLAAIDRARALEGVGPMVVPTDFTQLSVPEQLFVAVNLERVDRGLAPFVGMTSSLDANALRGARTANDPPDPGNSYLLFDGEWAGGSANALDAVYGWMYDDGLNSGNLDCLRQRAAGCWGHRHGILDDFGSSDHVVLGAALDPTGDTNAGDKGGTSMALSLAVASRRQRLLYTWPEAVAHLPAPGADG